MKEVKIGAYYTAYGETSLMIPDSVDTDSPDARKNILAYAQAAIDHIRLPEDTDYVDGSFEIDTEGDIRINGKLLR